MWIWDKNRQEILLFNVSYGGDLRGKNWCFLFFSAVIRGCPKGGTPSENFIPTCRNKEIIPSISSWKKRQVVDVKAAFKKERKYKGSPFLWRWICLVCICEYVCVCVYIFIPTDLKSSVNAGSTGTERDRDRERLWNIWYPHKKAAHHCDLLSALVHHEINHQGNTLVGECKEVNWIHKYIHDVYSYWKTYSYILLLCVCSLLQSSGLVVWINNM